MKLNDKIYETLKWICLVFIPALSTLLAVVLPSVNVGADTIKMILTILSAVATFIGTLIGISTVAYKVEQINENIR